MTLDYLFKLLNEMDSSVLGGCTASHNLLTPGDTYAPEDNRLPQLLGGVRKRLMTKKKEKNKKKNSRSKR